MQLSIRFYPGITVCKRLINWAQYYNLKMMFEPRRLQLPSSHCLSGAAGD